MQTMNAANLLVDRTAPVRPGEELDLEHLEPYLRRALGLFDGAFSVEQFPGGHSNLTYCVRIDGRELVLRRPPFGSKVKAAHDMGREYTILSHIHHSFPPAPKPLLYCEDETIIGAKFYVMERVKGLILRNEKPAGFALTPDQTRQLCLAIFDTLADLHALDWQGLGLGALQKKAGGFVERQVLGWDKRYYDSQTDDIPLIPEVFAWCKARIPADTGAVLIHNDYKFDNVILDPHNLTKVIGVLDWEMSTIGDPLYDLGVTLGYWLDPGEAGETVTRCFVFKEPGAISRREAADHYAKRTGRDVSNLHYYYVFALIKLSVVLQQIYYRYKHGFTRDERFAGMIDGVRTLAQRAADYIEKEDI